MSDNFENEISKRELDLAYEDRTMWRNRALRYEFILERVRKEIYDSFKEFGDNKLFSIHNWIEKVLRQEQIARSTQIGGKVFNVD